MHNFSRQNDSSLADRVRRRPLEDVELAIAHTGDVRVPGVAI